MNAVTMAADATSGIISSQYQDNIGLQVQWTGTPTGVLTIQASIDYNEVNGSGTFHDLSFTPNIGQPAGAASGYLINLNQLPFPFFRIKYVFTSGTGALSAWVTSKEI